MTDTITKEKRRRAPKQQYFVRVKCEVYKVLTVEGCSLEEAEENPWDYCIDEIETDMSDWEVLGVNES